MAFNRSKLGIDFTKTHTTQKHELGFRAADEVGGEFVYVVAGGTITQYAPVKIATGWSATVSGNAGRIQGVAQVAIASGSYGWVQTRGVAVVDAATDVDAGDNVAGVTDANGRVIESASVSEGGSATVTALQLAVIGHGLVNEAANVATILLKGL